MLQSKVDRILKAYEAGGPEGDGFLEEAMGILRGKKWKIFEIIRVCNFDETFREEKFLLHEDDCGPCVKLNFEKLTANHPNRTFLVEGPNL